MQWFHRARAEQAVSDDRSARASYEKAVASGTGLRQVEEQEAQFQLGRLHRESGALEQSEVAYSRALALGEAPGAHVMLAGEACDVT